MNASDLAIAQAMVFGTSSGLDEESYFLFAQSGLAHLLCASGYHLVLAAAFGLGILRGLQKLGAYFFPEKRFFIYHRYWDSLIIALATIYFLALAGSKKTIVRAAFALALGLIPHISGHRLRSLAILLLSVLFALAWGSGSGMSLLLSGLSTASLYFCATFPFARPWQRNLSFLLAPWLITSPLILWNFHLFSVLSPCFNLLTPLLVGGILFPGFLACLCDSLHLPVIGAILWQIAAYAAGLAQNFLTWACSHLPAALWVNPHDWLRLYLFSLFCFFLLTQKQRLGLALASSLGILLVAGIYLRMHVAPAQATLLNVGQGDSILLENPPALPMLIDFGKPSQDPYPSPSSQELARLTIRELGAILLTHTDVDHSGGLASILLRNPLHSSSGKLWLRLKHLDFAAIRKTLRISERMQAPIRLFPENTIVSPYPGLKCALLPASNASSNASSPLCRFEMNGHSLLLTGDMDAKTEIIYANQYPDLIAATYLKVAHHGSKSSTSSEFLELVRPQSALISVGIHNPYHHPHPELLERLQRAGITIRRTDLEGAIQVR